jgi:hypothetical protein
MLFTLAVSSAGCLGNVTSIFRDFDIGNGESVSIDAQQRVVLASKGTDPLGYQITTVCAEPSPDVYSVIGSSLAGKGSSVDKITAEFAASLSQSGANIGLRTQAIQLLRDSMYRLCEGYLSGALDRHEFKGLQRRYQNVMLGLLAVEQLTGAVTPHQTFLKAGQVSETAKGIADAGATAKKAKADSEVAFASHKKAKEDLDALAAKRDVKKGEVEKAKRSATPGEAETAPKDPLKSDAKNPEMVTLEKDLEDLNKQVKAAEEKEKSTRHAMEAAKNELIAQESNRDAAQNEALKTKARSEGEGDPKPAAVASSSSTVNKDTVESLGYYVNRIISSIVNADYSVETCLDTIGPPTPPRISTTQTTKEPEPSPPGAPPQRPAGRQHSGEVIAQDTLEMCRNLIRENAKNNFELRKLEIDSEKKRQESYQQQALKPSMQQKSD